MGSQGFQPNNHHRDGRNNGYNGRNDGAEEGNGVQHADAVLCAECGVGSAVQRRFFCTEARAGAVIARAFCSMQCMIRSAVVEASRRERQPPVYSVSVQRVSTQQLLRELEEARRREQHPLPQHGGGDRNNNDDRQQQPPNQLPNQPR